jgi:predicted permease
MSEDVRHALRRLGRSPGLLAVAMLSLGLGIGGSTTLFSLVNALLLRPLPVDRPDELLGVFTSDFSGDRYGGSSYPDYLDFREGCSALGGLVAHAPQPLNLVSGTSAEMIVSETVSGNFFGVLGVPAERGRALLPSDDRPGAELAVVLSHGLWAGRFASDESLVGRSLVLSGRPFTVVGIAPQRFTGVMRGLRVDAWVPLAARSLLQPSDPLANRGSRELQLLARLRPGATLGLAQAQLESVAAGLARTHTEAWTDVGRRPRRVSTLPESQIRLDPRIQLPFLGVSGALATIIALVLLVVCANLAMLLVARASERRREVAVRLSLGAGRLRLARAFMTECVLLALAGGAAGLLAAAWATDALRGFQPALPIPIEIPLDLDGRAVLFGTGLALLLGLALGLLPALQASHPSLLPVLQGGAGTLAPRSRSSGVFVAAQVTLSLVLLACGGLMLRSLRNATALDPGFQTRNAILVSLDLGLAGYGESQGGALYERLAERAVRLPGATAASWTSSAPFSLDWMRRGVWPEGHQAGPGEEREEAFSVVGPGFFETMGVPLVQGRGFGAADREGAKGVAVVNEAFARRYWPGQDTLGRRLSVMGPEGPFLEVVGVTRDGKYWTLGEEPRPFYYLPLLQHYEPSATLIVRTAGAPETLMAPLRAAVQDLDRGLPVLAARTLSEQVGLSLLPSRVIGWALGLFGLLALGLACLGVSALVAYATIRRTREVGIRMALGAERGQVLRLMLGEGMRPVAVGLGLGLALSTAASHWLTALLYGLHAWDAAATLLTVAVVFGAVCLAAGYLPARRAARIDPVSAMRHD